MQANRDIQLNNMTTENSVENDNRKNNSEEDENTVENIMNALDGI